jgi:nicotinamidase-related amidase
MDGRLIMQALVVIDMLNDFVTGKLACGRAQRIIPNIKKLIETAHMTGRPVIFSNDAHLSEGDGEFDIWGPHAIAGSEGAQVIAELAPGKGDHIAPKRRYSGFQGTDLEIYLREGCIDWLVLTGLHTNICVRHTCADAFFRGYKITVPEDCVESFTEEDHREALKYIAKVYGVRLTDSGRLVQEWKSKAAA